MSTSRLYFGIPVGAISFWIEEEAWEAVQGSVNPNNFKGCPCWLSLDLSRKNDLTALTAVWVKDGRLYAYTWYWTPAHRLKDRALKDHASYPEWAEEGFIEIVPGPVIEKTFVARKVKDLYATHDVQLLAFDPAGIDDFIKACEQVDLDIWKFEGPDKREGQGLMLVNHAQGSRVRFEDKQLCMPRSIERFEDHILHGTITIAESPVTYMCAANAVVDGGDGQDNRYFHKKKSRGRIDGIVTIAMASGATALKKPDGGPDMDAILARPAIVV